MNAHVKTLLSTGLDFLIKAGVPIALGAMAVIFRDYLSEYNGWGILAFFVAFTFVSYFAWNWLVKILSNSPKTNRTMHGITVFLLLALIVILGYLCRNNLYVSRDNKKVLIVGNIYTEDAKQFTDIYIDTYDLYRFFQKRSDLVWVDAKTIENLFYGIFCLFIFLAIGFLTFIKETPANTPQSSP
jgi:hypothetical protein